ncbi:MAG: AI-2E family transporter [Bacteroidetes bacterium]|nr:AI-2E family transporter [Bacteroidota bacterium]
MKSNSQLSDIQSNSFEFPFYAQAALVLIGLYVLISILYITADIVVPLVFAVVIAILISPVVSFFVRHKINRILAIVITLLMTFVVISALCLLLFSQASRFSDSWPVLVEKFTEIINQSITWVSSYFDIKPQKIHEWILKTKTELLVNSNAAIGQTIVIVGGGIVVLFLVPIYVFIILYYQPLLLDFIYKVFAKSDQHQVREIVTQTKSLIQRYLGGLLIEAIMVAVLDVGALLLLGIDYAILLGIIGALLNVIPYIGGIVAVALPMLVAIATKSSAWYAIYVMIAYYVIQLIDNNYIVPIIVSSKVRINALFSIIVVFAGNALWGVAGMFLSIPLLAIVKLICDHIEPLKPWGLLLGDTMPSIVKLRIPRIRKAK